MSDKDSKMEVVSLSESVDDSTGSNDQDGAKEFLRHLQSKSFAKPSAKEVAREFAKNEPKLIVKLDESPKAKNIRRLLIALTALTGFALGTLALLGPFSIKDFTQYLRFGPSYAAGEIQIIKHRGAWAAPEKKDGLFLLEYTVANYQKEEVNSFPIKIVFFSDQNEFLYRHQFNCCEESIPVSSKRDLHEIIPLDPSWDIGSYELRMNQE